jgi:hypothetical protein
VGSTPTSGFFGQTNFFLLVCLFELELLALKETNLLDGHTHDKCKILMFINLPIFL